MISFLRNMLLILSPSKTMNFDLLYPQVGAGLPLFAKEAAELMIQLKDFSIDDILQKEKLSLNLARSTYEHIQSFEFENTPEKPALFAFDGTVFDKLQASNLQERELLFLQNHLRIFSAVYGILSPFDCVRPYRLDMKSELVKGLYDYWRQKVTDELIRLLPENDFILINLASNEYFKMIDRKRLPSQVRIVTPVFKQEIKGRLATNGLYAKYARGLMTRFIAENAISDVELLKAFDLEGYFFNPHLSGENEWIFVN